MMKEIVLLAGPGGYAFNSDNVKAANSALKNQSDQVTVFGDGEKSLSDSDLEKFFQYIEKSNTEITLIIMAHGHLVSTKHYLKLSDKNSISTRDFLIRLSDSLNNRAIDILSLSCYGGAASSEANDTLPQGSTYIALSKYNESLSGSDIDRLWNILSYSNLNGTITAEALLLMYLTSALENRTTPAIFSTEINRTDISSVLTNKLKSTFSLEEQTKIIRYLSRFTADEEKIIKVLKKINDNHSEYSITARDYGMALAICFVAEKYFNVNNPTLPLTRKSDEPIRSPLFKMFDQHQYSLRFQFVRQQNIYFPHNRFMEQMKDSNLQRPTPKLPIPKMFDPTLDTQHPIKKHHKETLPRIKAGNISCFHPKTQRSFWSKRSCFLSLGLVAIGAVVGRAYYKGNLPKI